MAFREKTPGVEALNSFCDPGEVTELLCDIKMICRSVLDVVNKNHTSGICSHTENSIVSDMNELIADVAIIIGPPRNRLIAALEATGLLPQDPLGALNDFLGAFRDWCAVDGVQKEHQEMRDAHRKDMVNATTRMIAACRGVATKGVTGSAEENRSIRKKLIEIVLRAFFICKGAVDLGDMRLKVGRLAPDDFQAWLRDLDKYPHMKSQWDAMKGEHDLGSDENEPNEENSLGC